MRAADRQGQAHIVSTAIVLPRSGKRGGTFRTWFSIDPQPASISPTININIIFICAFLVHCRRTARHPSIKSDKICVLERFRSQELSLIAANVGAYCIFETRDTA